MWLNHDSHDSVKEFVCALPLAYFRFCVHDQYKGSTGYQMDTLFRVFVLKERYGWEHETALVNYLGNRRELPHPTRSRWSLLEEGGPPRVISTSWVPVHLDDDRRQTETA